MKIRSTLLFAPALLLLAVGCSKLKEGTLPDTKIHSGKILMGYCGNFTVQFTDGSPLGQVGWAVPYDSAGRVYNNVFRVGNPCSWGKTKESDIIRFRFTHPVAQQCVQCMAWIATPDTAYDIEVIE